nr:hypothetical protein [Nanoarchaeota archaeon]
MQELITKMKDNQWGIAQFRSGNKFGTVVDITGKTNEFYKEIEINGKEKWVINTDNLITQVIDYKYMGIQQDILPEIKKDSTVGVQQRRIIQSNLFENGKIAPGAEDLESIVEEYNNVQKEITKGELSAFMEEMSIKAVDGVYKITDGTKFIDFLTRAAEERGSSQNILDSIAALHLYDEETGESIGIDKLDLVISQEKIENLLMALVNNTVIREKRTGGSKVQAASTGFELRARSKEGGLFISEELSFYKEDENGKLLGMEVAIPAPPALLSAYGTIDNLNKALERGELDHIKNLMGYRIPTQAPGSIDFMQIKKFLPTEAGDIIVLPAAIVAKAGSDFDIDKMNIFMKEFELNYKEEEKVTLTEDSNTKEWKQNRLIDLSIDILSHPYVRRQLFTAINTELMVGDQGIVTDIRNLKRKEKEEVSLTKVVEGNHNQDMFFYFLSGKTGVGQDAVHIAHHPLTQRAGTYIQTEQGNEKAPIRLFFEHNEIEIEGQKYPSLAGIRDVSGREWIT